EGNLIKRSIRDLYNKDVEEVVVAGDHAYREAKDFMRMLMPSHAKNVVAFKDPEPLFTRYQIERQLNAMFLPQVTLKSGGYLVINQTEALVAVDVNSGRSTREFSIEETALHTNLEAAEELARQLKLRDLAGLIVVDFIDMEEKRNNRAVERKLKDALRHDRARIQVGRISHFGLLEMSRQRMRTGVLEGSTTQCSHCQGTGIIRSTESISLAVLRGLEDAVMTRQRGSLTATTSAAVALYILNNKRDFVVDMENRCGYAITIDASDKVVGANFSIERGPANVAPNRRVADKSAVNMDWGFETDDEEAASAPVEAEADDENVSARSNADEDANGRKRRRRRRRGGRRTSENAGEEFNGADDGDGEDENRDASASEATANDGESDDGETSDDDKPRSRRGRRRGRRGGRRNRERQASRDESGEETENAGQDTDGEEATAENSDGADIPGLGPQPSISASVIEITTPGANTEDEQRPEAGTDDAPAAVIADEVEVSAAPNADELETEPEAEAEAEKPKRRSRARSTTGRTATRRAKPKTDNDAEPAKALDTPEASTDADTNVDDQHAPAEPAPTEPAKVDHADSIAATAGDIADADDTSADRSKRTAPVMDKPRVERVTVGPPGSEKSDSNDTAPAAPTADDDTTDKPSRRGWWQRRILGD
ncbi:MAG: ribonuclease E/G, partial [Pseudomonadota bacterium]